jgi:hypothetical protein
VAPASDHARFRVTWNQIVVLGIAVSLVALALSRGVRQVSPAALERRCRWAIRLTLGFGAVLLIGVIVPLSRFLWALADSGSTEEQRTLLLGLCLSAAFNLVLGFLAFGTLPTGVAFMLARRMQR